MNFTLHLTDACNLDCAYCPAYKNPKRMTEEIVYAACELAFSKGTGGGFCYFGGEPMLERGLILKGLRRCRELAEKTGKRTSSRMTTNGTLLDAEFLDIAKKEGMRAPRVVRSSMLREWSSDCRSTERRRTNAAAIRLAEERPRTSNARRCCFCRKCRIPTL